MYFEGIVDQLCGNMHFHTSVFSVFIFLYFTGFNFIIKGKAKFVAQL